MHIIIIDLICVVVGVGCVIYAIVSIAGALMRRPRDLVMIKSAYKSAARSFFVLGVVFILEAGTRFLTLGYFMMSAGLAFLLAWFANNRSK